MSTTETPLLAIDDDDLDSSRTLAVMVASLGFVCELHDCAKSLLRGSASTKYDVIVLDLTMPGVDGIELLRYFADTTMNLPMVLISGHSPRVLVAAQIIALKSGLLNLGKLVKPIRLSHIAESLYKCPSITKRPKECA